MALHRDHPCCEKADGGGPMSNLKRHAASHPVEALVIEIALKLEGDLAHKIEAIAARRGQPPVEMLADAVNALIVDDMFDAVIDAGLEVVARPASPRSMKPEGST